MANDQRLLVLYDGGCPLCRREIDHYRRLPSAPPIEWIDITQAPGRLKDLGIGLNEAMAEFHVIDPDGAIHKGADGFVKLWDALPRYQVLARLYRALPLRPLLRRLYAQFARWHYRRRCAQGACHLGPE